MSMSNDDGAEDSSATSDRGAMLAQQHFDPRGDGDLTTTIVYTVAEADGVEPPELMDEPLYDSVDATALEATLFRNGHASGSRTGTGTLSFEYLDYVVTVGDDGWVKVYERQEGTDGTGPSGPDAPETADEPDEPGA